ncbi:MAG TPA: MMPL family transporter [Streptosporangiaceae bacterium]|jgi:RND superfamily putative drug exporter
MRQLLAAPAPELPARRPLIERIACWSVRHRKTAVLGWLAFVAAAVIVGQAVGTSGAQQYDPGQSGQAEQMLTRLHVASPPAESVLVEARHRAGAVLTAAGAAITAGEVRQAAREVASALTALPRDAARIRSPFSRGGGELLSADHHAALVTFQVAGPDAAADHAVAADLAAVARVQARHPGLVVAEAGAASTDRAASAMLGHDFAKARNTTIPLTLILLVCVFGALIAAGIPVLLAGTAVTAAISLLAIPGQWFPVSGGASEIVLVIGMAVGVDYTLFYLRREREERAAGRSRPAALAIAAATSGRAIVISGVTVMISLAGLFLSGLNIFTGISAGTIMVVGVTVLGSLTFLPALLSWLGPWTDRGRLPWLGRRRCAAESSRLWAGLARRVVARPVLWGAAGIVALLALGAPALGMRLSSPAVDLPSSLPVVRTLSQIQQQFPGRPAPAEVVVTGAHLRDAAVQRGVAALAASATATGPVRGPVSARLVGGGRGMVIQVPLAGDGSGQVSQDAVLTLRDRVLPATLGQAGVTYAVTGPAAWNHDLDSALHSRTPLVFAVVAGLAFVVLLCAFGSLAIPLVSIGLNLLSVGAAYGVVTLIFQDGHLEGPLGFTSFGGIIPWVPLFSFVLLFGLSMDYHVFILSRIRELWCAGLPGRTAVVQGIGASAGVVTSAAVIMVAVFSLFATLSGVDVKMLGVGLSVAVLVDATLVRGVILPAALALLGERAWYLPRWLAWLPGRSRASQASQQAAAPQPAAARPEAAVAGSAAG